MSKKPTKAEAISNLLRTAEDAIGYVGYANYEHRENNAREAVRESARTGKYVDVEEVDKRTK